MLFPKTVVFGNKFSLEFKNLSFLKERFLEKSNQNTPAKVVAVVLGLVFCLVDGVLHDGDKGVARLKFHNGAPARELKDIKPMLAANVLGVIADRGEVFVQPLRAVLFLGDERDSVREVERTLDGAFVADDFGDDKGVALDGVFHLRHGKADDDIDRKRRKQKPDKTEDTALGVPINAQRKNGDKSDDTACHQQQNLFDITFRLIFVHEG